MQRGARKSARCNLDRIQCLRMFEGRNPPGDATKSCAQFPSSGMHSSRASAHGCRPGRPMRRNYSDDFLVPVEGVSLILSRVHASALHLIVLLHLNKRRSTAPLMRATFIPYFILAISFLFLLFVFFFKSASSVDLPLHLQTKCLHIAICRDYRWLVGNRYYTLLSLWIFNLI